VRAAGPVADLEGFAQIGFCLGSVLPERMFVTRYAACGLTAWTGFGSGAL
jgi:hypothetical protein